MSKVLSVLISINVQAKSDINLGVKEWSSQIKGWLSNRVFMQAKHMQFIKWLGVAELILVHLLTVLLVSGFSFVHTVVYDANKQAHNQDT